MSTSIRSIPAAMLLVLLLLGLGVYVQGAGDYWLYDDHPNLVNNPALDLSGTELDDWRTAALSSNSGPLRRPIVMFSFAVDRVVAGELSAPWLKFMNILIHGLTALVLWALYSSLFCYLRTTHMFEPPEWLALAAAVAWALHPLHVSTVLYPVQRMAQFSALFVVLGLWVFCHYRTRWAERGGSVGDVVAAGLWFSVLTACAGLSKENGLLLPWMLVALEFTVFRGRWQGQELPWLNRVTAGMLLLPALVLVGVVLLAPDWLVNRYAMREFDLAERVQTQLRLLWIYVRWLLLPDITQYGLHHDAIAWSRSLLEPLTTLLALLAWIAVIVSLVWNRRAYPALTLGILLFLIGHSMESSAWPLLMVFEHRNYLPSIGVILALVAVISGALNRNAGDYRFLPVLLLPLVLFVTLVLRVHTWSAEESLGQAALRHHPQSALSHYVYANSRLRLAESDLVGDSHLEALVLSRYHFEQAVGLAPRDLGALVTLHQLDSTYFSRMPERTDWLARVELALNTTPLYKEDGVALENLMRCLGDGGCEGGAMAFEQISATLAQRFPNWSQRYLLAHSYAVKSGVDAAARIPGLLQGLAEHPGHMGLLLKALADAVEMGDMGLVYSIALKIHQADPRRYQLSRMTALFPPAVELEYAGN